MFSDILSNLVDYKQLQTVVNSQFTSAIKCCIQENPEEAEEYELNGVDVSNLYCNSIVIKKSLNPKYQFYVEAEYHYNLKKGKVVYIIKFWDNFVIFDDVLYTEKG